MSFEETLISVWRAALVDGVEKIELNGQLFPVRRTPKKRLRQVDFDLDGEAVRGLEQNPETSLPLGAAGEPRSQDHAVSFQRPIHRQRSRRQGQFQQTNSRGIRSC
jgi:hypothetical protein